MTIQSSTASWLRYLSGEPLTEVERQELEREVVDDDVLRASLAEDQRLHRLLSSVGSIDASRDKFVGNVVAACAGVDSTFAVAPAATQELPPPPSSSVPPRRNPLVMVLSGAVLILTVALFFVTVQYFRMQRSLAQAETQTPTKKIAATHPDRISEPQPDAAPGPARDPQPSPVADADDPEQVHQAAADDTDVMAIARISRSDRAVWKNAPSEDAIPAGRLELLEGEVDLTFTGGSRITLQAPVAMDLLDATHVRLDKGRLTALVPPHAIGFRVDTPNSNVVDLGTLFGVAVNDLGQSDVDLIQGEVVVIPWRGDDTGRRWHLKSGQYNRATVFPAPDAKESLLASRISGPAGFRGEIQLSGASMDFSSEEHFDRIQQGVRKRFKESAAKAAADWLALAKTFNQTNGSFTMNGKDVSFEGLDGLLDIEDSMLDPPRQPDGVQPQQAGFFFGTMMINGQKRTFNSREEYEEFRREMMQPLEKFHFASPAETQLERDKRTNPFQR